MATSYGPIPLVFEDRNDWVLGKVLETRAQTHGDHPFLQYRTEAPLSYREVNGIVNRVAHGLARLSVGKGDTVMIMLPNCLEYLYTWFAVNKLGAIEVPVNNAYKGYFFEHVANNCQAKVLVVDQEFLDRVEFSEGNCPHLEHLIVHAQDGVDRAAIPAFQRVKTSTFEELYDNPEGNPGSDVRYYDPAAIMYTSGTTGPSKGVLMPHAQLYFFANQDVALLHLTDRDVYYACNPLFHGNAQLLAVYPALVAGARMVIYPTFSASEWLDHIRVSGATVTNFLGVMMDFVYKQPPRPEDSQHNLRVIFAVPAPAAIVDDFRHRFKVPRILEGYGMTEICMATLMPYDEFRHGSCGKVPEDWFDVRIVDPETDEELPPNQLGELVIRHKVPWTLNAGYYRMPEKTVEAYRNLWFHTGDGLTRDEEGFFYFVDRLKDALRRRGENISSYEVESVILSHPAVAEVGVVAVKSPLPGGEDEVKACVVLKQGVRLSPEELIMWCDDRMPYFAVPRYVEFLDGLPKTPSGKIQKHKLREAGTSATTWDRVEAGFKLKEEIKKAERKKKEKARA